MNVGCKLGDLENTLGLKEMHLLKDLDITKKSDNLWRCMLTSFTASIALLLSLDHTTIYKYTIRKELIRKVMGVTHFIHL